MSDLRDVIRKLDEIDETLSKLLAAYCAKNCSSGKNTPTLWEFYLSPEDPLKGISDIYISIKKKFIWE